ncbi:MAG: phosphotransferase [Deltaproteobacteria bacterium]|nr:phosphotransferase [Deltaproteobacteria bacterium]
METVLVRHEFKFVSDFLNSAEFSVIPLDGDVSHRIFFRVKTSSQSYVLMRSLDISIVPYVEIAQFLLPSDIRVPRIFASSKSLGLVLMEDGGDVLLQTLAASPEEKLFTCYKKVLDQLVKLQLLNTNQTPLYSYFEDNKFTSDLFYKELLFTEEYLLHHELHLDFDAESYRLECRKLSDSLITMPFKLTHRDFHSRNILINNDAPLLLDFQDTRLGPYFYDATSLIEDSYVNLPKPFRTRLLHYYLVISQTPYSLVDYSATQLQRSLKAAGTFAYAKVKKNTSYYLQYLPTVLNFAAEAVQPLAEEYPLITKLLEDISE